MNTVFRIDDVRQLDGRQNTFDVRLTLTDCDDPELKQLSDQIEQDFANKSTWDQLGRLLIQVGQANKAEECYLKLLRQRGKEADQAEYYYHLGLIKAEVSSYKEAIQYYEKAISIQENTRLTDASTLATSYDKVGIAYMKMGEYSRALELCKKAIPLYEKTLPADHPNLARSYNSIGEIYMKMGEYSRALDYFNRAVSIQKKTCPRVHPDVAQSHENLGGVSQGLKKYVEALLYFEMALNIYGRCLPAGHNRTESVRKSIEEVKRKM